MCDFMTILSGTRRSDGLADQLVSLPPMTRARSSERRTIDMFCHADSVLAVLCLPHSGNDGMVVQSRDPYTHENYFLPRLSPSVPSFTVPGRVEKTGGNGDV